MLPKDTPNIHAKTRSGGGSRRLLPVAYIYPLFCRWYGGRTFEFALTVNRIVRNDGHGNSAEEVECILACQDKVLFLL